jgi:hypothetical protein
MPTYDFLNEKTGETFTEAMSIAEKEKYLKKNKHIKQQLCFPFIGDAVRQGITKPPADFQRHVLGRIKNAPASGKKNIIGERHFSIPKEW